MNQPAQDAVEIEQAKRNAEVAKERVQTTAGALKQRLNPKNLAADAVETVKEKTAVVGGKASDAARRRPRAAAAAAAVATLIVLRKPVKKIGRKLFGSSDRAERRRRKEAKLLAKVGYGPDGVDGNAKVGSKTKVVVVAPPGDLIPNAAATEAGAVPAKQE